MSNSQTIQENNARINAVAEVLKNKAGGSGTSTEVIDSLDSDSTAAALSANQGRILNEKIPVKLSQLENDTNFITSTVENLTNYYSKSEVNGLVNAISKFSALIVTTLPTSNISTTTIYLIAKTDSEANDYYDEYLYINNAWEMIGNTKIDLSNYYTKGEISTILGDYAKANAVMNKSNFVLDGTTLTIIL